MRAGRLERADIEPPVTQHLTDQELQTLLPQSLELDLPLSTVTVERAVKATTAAVRVCADSTEQDGVSLQPTLQGRKIRAQPVTYMMSRISKSLVEEYSECGPADTLLA